MHAPCLILAPVEVRSGGAKRMRHRAMEESEKHERGSGAGRTADSAVQTANLSVGLPGLSLVPHAVPEIRRCPSR
jgi:hypothetical protein